MSRNGQSRNNQLRSQVYQPLEYIPITKEQQIAQEIKANLFKVPNEDEIIKDWEEVEKAQELQERWMQIKQEQQIQNAKITNKKIQKINEEQLRLAARLEELVNNNDDTDYVNERMKMVALKRRIEQDNINEKQKLQECFQVKKEQEYIKMVQKRMEAVKLLEKKKQISEQMKHLQNEISVIDEVKKEKDMVNLNVIDRALKRFDNDLVNKIPQRDRVLMADNILELNTSKEEKEVLFKEVWERVEERRKADQIQNNEKIQQLQLIKAAIDEKQQKLLREKAIQGEILKQKLDYLQDDRVVQNISYIEARNNVKITDDILSDYKKNQVKLDPKVLNAQNLKSNIEQRLNELKQQAEIDRAIEAQLNKPYQGELKPFLNAQNPETLFITRKILEEIIEVAIREIIDQEIKINQGTKLNRELELRHQKMQETAVKQSNRILLQQIADGMFQRMANKIMKEAKEESVAVNNLAKSISLNVIVNAIKLERNSSNTNEQIQSLFMNLREPKTNKKINKDIKFKYQSQSEIDWKKVKKGKKIRNKVQAHKQLNVI